MLGLLNTLRQIWNSDSVHPAVGYMRHVQWQIRRLARGFPIDLPLSHSVVHVASPVGVGALVNAMGKYDYHNMSFIAELLDRFGGVFVDVGANIGTYTLVASEVPGARVISIEPHPATFAQLVENVKRNVRENVVCINVALSDRLGSVCLTDRPDSSVNRVLQADDHRAGPCQNRRGRTRESRVGWLRPNGN